MQRHCLSSSPAARRRRAIHATSAVAGAPLTQELVEVKTNVGKRIEYIKNDMCGCASFEDPPPIRPGPPEKAAPSRCSQITARGQHQEV